MLERSAAMTNSPFVIFQKNCDEAVLWAVHKLEFAGFRAMRTFDLQAARHAHLECACPHHGTAECDCQMVVVLIYQANNPPASLLIHSSGEASSFFLVNTPQQSIPPTMERNIQEALTLEIDIAA